MFSSQKNQKVIESVLARVESLNPHLIDSDKVWEMKDLYMQLKLEGWRVLPNGMLPLKKNQPELPKEFIENLRENVGKVYSLEGASETDIHLYYANALQGLYLFVARQIRETFVEQWTGAKAHKEAKLFLKRLYDDLLLFDLGRTETPPELAEEALQVDMLKLFSWEKAYRIAREYYEKKVAGDLREWLEKNPDFSQLKQEEQKRLFQSFEKKQKVKRYCCKNNPGCLFCPNNRAFLSKSEN